METRHREGSNEATEEGTGRKCEAVDHEITHQLEAWARGEAAAEEGLFAVVYPELRKIARQYLARDGSRGVLQTTEIAHEAYLRLAGQRSRQWRNRGHFFAHFATHLRRALVDEARSRQRLKRGGRSVCLALEDLHLVKAAPDPDLLALDQALTQLARIDPLAASVVELRCFTGLSLAEIAQTLGKGETTVKRKWKFSQTFLAEALGSPR